jgi:rhamnosyltransferase
MTEIVHEQMLSTNAISTPTVPRKENVCAVVISYFPKGDLLSYVQRVQFQVAKIVIIDNGSLGEAANSLSNIECQTEIYVIRNSNNVGVAAALNQGAQWAINMGYEWILALDQDTMVADGFVAGLVTAYQQFPCKGKLAIIASNFKDLDIKFELLPLGGNDPVSWTAVDMAITSGSLFSLSAFSAIGRFREELFIDSVDFEYCLRASSKGYKIIVARNALTEHSIGAGTLHKLPFKKNLLITTNHSPVRRYYMMRNQLVLAREYLWTQPGPTACMLYGYLKAFVTMVLFEKQIARKLKFVALGLWDGLFCNFQRKVS